MGYPLRTSARSRRQPRCRRIPVLGVLLFFILVSPCLAMPGDVLLENCLLSSDPLYPLEGGVCWGYLLGAWHTHRDYQSTGQVPRTICAEVPVPVGEIADAFLAWAKVSPGELHRPASECVLAALRAAFPCPPPGK